MDLTSPLKPDVFRVVVVILLPGLLAVFPWLAWFFWPELLNLEFWKDGSLVAGFFVLALALVTGMILEDLGAHIELQFVDPYVCKEKGVDHDNFVEQWMAYLMTSCNHKYVAHRYLGTMVTRFKFELSMLPACCSVGLALVVASLHGVGFEPKRMFAFLVVDAAIFFFMWDQAKKGGWQLHELRLRICEEEKSAIGSTHTPQSVPVVGCRSKNDDNHDNQPDPLSTGHDNQVAEST